MKTTISIALLLFSCAGANASEYCERIFYEEIGKVNSEAASILEWQKTSQNTAEQLESGKAMLSKAIDNVTDSEKYGDAEKINLIKTYRSQQRDLTNKTENLASENYEKNLRLGELRTSIPEALQKKAGDCAKEVAPANMVVNFIVQGLAVVLLGDAKKLLPNEKSLYIDMGEVLNGNVMGGPDSAPNVAKEWINGRLGLHL